MLRQYLPKGMDLSGHSQEALDAIARQLNERPRKTLVYRSRPDGCVLRFDLLVAGMAPDVYLGRRAVSLDRARNHSSIGTGGSRAA
jgi:hypothetical protein